MAETKPAQTNPEPVATNAAGASGGNSPSSAPAKPTGTSAAPSSLPSEYAGKSAEEIYNDLSGRYKDYDTIKERAALADKWGETGYKSPDEVRQLRDWAMSIAQATANGKAVVWDGKANQYRLIDQPNAAPQQQANPYEGWETLMPEEQGKRMGSMIEQQVMSRVQDIAKQYEQRLAQELGNLQTRNDLFLTLMEQKLADPDLDIRAALDNASKVTSLKGEDLIKWAVEQTRAPRVSKKERDEAVGAAIAKARAEWEAEHNANAAPIMDTPRTWADRNRMVNNDGKAMSREEENRHLLRSFREKGWLRGN